MILYHGFYHMVVPNKIETLLRTNDEPYNKTLMSNQKLQRFIKQRVEQEALHRENENLYGKKLAKKLPGYPKVQAGSTDYYLHKEIIQLCKGDLTVIDNLHKNGM